MTVDTFKENGFTLLELILALLIVGFIVGISLGGVRLGVSAREIGEQKVDTYQRLRVIGSQLSQKIKSTYPVFILPQQDFLRTADDKLSTPPRILAFEGKEDSIRFITFSEPLTSAGQGSRAHEVRFYLGEHPDSGKTGLLMMEHDYSGEDIFPPTRPTAENARYFLLAENVDYLKFRYYLMEKLTVDNQENSSFPQYTGKWVKQIRFDPVGIANELPQERQARLEAEKERISLPRAVEFSLGLKEKSHSANDDTYTIIAPPFQVLLYAGMNFALPVKEDENDAT